MVEAYASQEATSWTRIEMLIALYDATIVALEEAGAAATANEDFRATSHLLRATDLMVGILSGINRDAGDVAEQVERLCHFVVQCIRERKIDPAINIMRALREGFEGIREEANQLESIGQLPDLNVDSSLISSV